MRMSTRVRLETLKLIYVFSEIIPDNIDEMTKHAGMYDPLFHPQKIGIKRAYQLINPLMKGLDKMKNNPKVYREFQSSITLGAYDELVPWLEKYIAACIESPNTEIRVIEL